MAIIKNRSDINKIRRPKTRKGKRFLLSREPKLIEDTKNAIFMRGSTASEKCVKLLKDICSLKKPNSVFFKRKESWRPFEDSTNIEFMALKNDSPLFMFANHSKKRPNNLIMGRIFDEHILDMVEFGFDNFKSLDEFKVSKIAVGTKPIVIFSGEPFDVQFEYQRIKNLLLDFFSGPIVESIRLSGLEHVINFVATDGKILMRSYKVLLKKSGTRWPRIELEEIGPRIDLTLRRTHLASQDLFKRSLRQPEELKKKTIKNINKDKLGSTLGRIHLQRQDYNKLQLRKLKAFKNTLKDNPNKGKKRSIIPTEDNNNEDISVDKETNDSINNDNKEIVSTSVNPKKKVRFSL